MIGTTLLVIASVLILLKIKKVYKYWDGKGIRYIRPWKVFGFMAPQVIRWKSFAHVLQYICNAFPEQRYFGAFQFLLPTVIVRDPKLIQKIMVEDFDKFSEHQEMIYPEVDPILPTNLFTIKDEDHWNDLRSTLNRIFINRIPETFDLIKSCAQNFVDHFLENETVTPIELEDVTFRFSNDVIASVAFGSSCNSYQNPSNKFYLKTKALTRSSFIQTLEFFMHTFSPRLLKLSKCGRHGGNSDSFYQTVIEKAVQARKEEKTNRPDLIQFVLDASTDHAKKTKTAKIADVEEITTAKTADAEETKTAETEVNPEVTKVSSLLFSGLRTVFITLSHLTYELALNPEIQTKLRAEVDQTSTSCDGNLTSKDLLGMKYLDMVVSETLRKWPPMVVTDRKLVKPFKIEPEKVWEEHVYFDLGTTFLFPIYAIHRDWRNYPEPDRFDPERFGDGGQIKPGTYLPFGLGLRKCLGMQLALVEIKTFVFHLLKTYEVVPVKKTKNPLVLSRKNLNLVPDGGFWVGLKKRRT